MRSKHPTSVTFLVRGIVYSLTSTLVILSGYLIESTNITSDLILITVPISISISFFVIYAACYHYQDPKSIVDKQLFIKEQNGAIAISIVISVLLSVLSILAYSFANNNKLPQTGLLLLFCFQAVVFLSYAFFILYRHRNEIPSLIRHQLVWPTVLTIGVNFYIGIFYREFASPDFTLVLPVVLLILYMIIATRFSKRVFVVIGMVSFVGLSLFLYLAGFGFINIPEWISKNFSIMIFCLSTSGYLAVFEAWRITSHIAAQQSAEEAKTFEALFKSDSIEDFSLSFQYYAATMTSLTVSATIVPFTYIWSNFGNIFLFVFTIHAIAALFFWSYSIFINSKNIVEYDWILWKVIFGFLLLAIFIIDAKWNFQPKSGFMSPFYGYIWSGLLVAAIYSTRKIGKDFAGIRKSSDGTTFTILTFLFSRRLNQLRAASLFSFAFYTILLMVQSAETKESILYKADHAQFVYATLILIVVVADLISDSLS